MTSPGGREVGRVSIRVVPDTSKFREQLKRQLSNMEDVKVGIDIDGNGLREKVQAEAKKAAAGVKAEVKLDVDQKSVGQFAHKAQAALSHVNMPNFLGDMSRTDMVMRQVVANAQRIRESLVSASTSLKDWTRSALNVKQHFTDISARVRLLATNVQGLGFDKVERDVDKTSSSFRKLGSTGSTMWDGVEAGGSAVGSMFGTIGDEGSRAFGKVGGGLKPLATSLQTMGTSLLSVGATLFQIGGVATLLAYGGAAITAAWGAVAAAVGAVPAAIALIGAPLAAVLLGMDGIKKAAQTLKPEFDKLKTAVSGAFEKGMLPVFNQLRTVFPSLQAGLTKTASSLSFVAAGIADVVVQADKAGTLEQIFNNVNLAISQLRPGLSDVIAGFLQVAAQGDAFNALTATVTTFGAAFRASVTDVIKDGTLSAAMQGLQGTLGELTTGFVDLVENGLRVFAAAAPGVNSFLDDLSGFFNRFDWAALGASVGDVFSGLGTALQNVPVGTINEIEAAFGRLGDTFKSDEFTGHLTNIVNHLPGTIDAINGFSQDFVRALDGITAAVDLFGTVDSKFRGFMDSMGQAADDFGKSLGLGSDSAFSKWATELDDQIDRELGIIPDKIRDFGAGTVKAFESGFAPLKDIPGTQVSPAIDAIVQSLTPPNVNVQEPWAGIPSDISGALAGVSQLPGLVQPPVAATVEALKPGTTDIGPAWSPLSQGIGDGLLPGLVSAQDTARTGTAGIGDALQPTGVVQAGTESGWGTFWNAIISLLGVKGSEAAVAAATATAGIGTATTDGLGAIPPVAEGALAPLPGMVQSPFDQAGVLAQQSLLSLGSNIQGAMAILTGIVQGGFPQIQTAFTTGWDQVSTSMNSSFQLISSGLMVQMTSLSRSVTVGFPAIQAAFTTGWTAVGASVTTSLTTINQSIIAGVAVWAISVQTGLTAMGTAVTTGFAGVQAAVTAALTTVNQSIIAGVAVWALSVQTGLTAMSTAVTTGFATVQATVTTQLAAINNLIIAGVAVWATSVTTQFAAIGTAVTTGMTQIQTTIQTTLDQITQIWQTATQQWVTLVTDAMTQLATAVSNGAQQALQALRNAVGEMVAVLEGAVPQFFAAGANMGQALADGLNSKAGAVEAAAARLANAAAAATRAAAGIASPSKVFTQLGRYLGEGLAVGMDKSNTAVEKSSKRMVGTVLSTADQLQDAFSSNKWEGSFSSVIPDAIESVGRVNVNDWQGEVNHEDYGDAAYKAVAEALAGWGIQIDANGLAKLVNKANTRKARRG